LEKLGYAVVISMIMATATMPIGMACSANSTEAARDVIVSALETWRSAFNNRDERHVCDLFAPDLIANHQGQPERDYAALCQLLLMSVQDRERTYRYSFEINEVLVFGATAIVRLVWTLEIERAGALQELIREPAIDIFRCEDDGDWKISRYLAYPATP
jgi:ketosteroid isomerase-like protein